MEYCEALHTAEFIALIDQWIPANPPYAAGAANDAWNTYALSLRVVVWMQQAACRKGDLPPGFSERLHASLVAQLTYLTRHLETDIGGNHLIKNVKALIWASRYFTDSAAHRWGAIGRKLLVQELDRQMLPDGMHFELSPAYHCQVFADLLEIRHVLDDTELAMRLDAVLARAAQVIADMAHPDGLIAQFSDAGLTMAYTPGECLDAHAALTGTRIEQQEIFTYPDAGYFGIRENNSYAVMDAGPIAPDALPAHGHGDMFSLEWSLDGERIIVDQGVLQYCASEERAASRSARFHNTLSLPGCDQAEFFDSFRSMNRARLVMRQVERDGTTITVTAAHDGFVRNGGPVHSRKAELAPRRLVIEDRLHRPATVAARIAFLLHPNIKAMQASASQIHLDGARARAAVNASHPLALEKAIWWPDIGCAVATLRIILTLPAGASQSWVEIASLDQIS